MITPLDFQPVSPARSSASEGAPDPRTLSGAPTFRGILWAIAFSSPVWVLLIMLVSK